MSVPLISKPSPIPQVSHQLPNLQKKRIYVPELKRFITVRISARALKTINKNGARVTLQKAGLL